MKPILLDFISDFIGGGSVYLIVAKLLGKCG